ncbi:hypothetical protein [Kitasatospora sp. NPDC059327]|uniref:hypothetical protein n=1 Tax=Kitasatospora sp. NPDC059327 TaxID=3346803 RepID=UPI0036C57C49
MAPARAAASSAVASAGEPSADRVPSAPRAFHRRPPDAASGGNSAAPRNTSMRRLPGGVVAGRSTASGHFVRAACRVRPQAAPSRSWLAPWEAAVRAAIAVGR